MKKDEIRLKHDIHGLMLVGGKGCILTSLNYLNSTCTLEEGAEIIAKKLRYRVGTKTAKYGARCAAFIGVCYEQKENLDNFDNSLNMVIKGINLNNSE